MPRRHGLDASTYFHVFNRGADRQDIFVGPSDHHRFEQLLADVVTDVGVRVHAYSLMTNHVHAVIEAEGDRLSRAMHHIGRTYAVYFNRSTDRSGPLCESRFKSVPIVGAEMLMVEGRYVHRNPVDIVGIDALTSYRFSSLAAYAGVRVAPEWLTMSSLMEPFSGDQQAMLRFVERTHPSDSQWAGSRPPLHLADSKLLATSVATACSVTVESLAVTGRGRRNDARVLLATMLIELRVQSASEVADGFGFSGPQAVRNAAARGRQRLATDPVFARLRSVAFHRLAELGEFAVAA